MSNSENKIVSKIVKEANIGIKKQAKLFNRDDIVTLVDQVQGLNKGTNYKVIDNSNPGYITIATFDPSDSDDTIGERIGEFRTDRFVHVNDVY